MKPLTKLILLLAILFLVVPAGAQEMGKLEPVARSHLQWTGIALAEDGTIFVNYPLWRGESNSVYVAKVIPPDRAVSYPDVTWNDWELRENSVEENFVCPQSVFIDNENNLWVLDTGNPRFGGVIKNAPKLMKIDLADNSIVRIYKFNDFVLPENGYLNDVRIDTRNNFAYITDSGAGAIIVVNLENGSMRRVLHSHPSTKAEKIMVNVNGEVWKNPDGSLPQIHADGIALDPKNEYLYYHALTGHNLYRINTRCLMDEQTSEENLWEKVEFVKETGPADGMVFGGNGRLYITNLENNSILVYNPADNSLELAVQSSELVWPDSMYADSQGYIYVTTSRINEGVNPQEPYRIFRFKTE
ncbi:MAG: L-dopachrome tautomerase-related protein [Vulcanimicrobiota bacterium]